MASNGKMITGQWIGEDVGAVVAYWGVLSWHSPEEIEENRENSQDDRVPAEAGIRTSRFQVSNVTAWTNLLGLNPEEVENMFIWNVGIRLQFYPVSQSKNP
jgi:hypothetical protein